MLLPLRGPGATVSMTPLLCRKGRVFFLAARPMPKTTTATRFRAAASWLRAKSGRRSGDVSLCRLTWVSGGLGKEREEGSGLLLIDCCKFTVALSQFRHSLADLFFTLPSESFDELLCQRHKDVPFSAATEPAPPQHASESCWWLQCSTRALLYVVPTGGRQKQLHGALPALDILPAVSKTFPS